MISQTFLGGVFDGFSKRKISMNYALIFNCSAGFSSKYFNVI